MYIFVEGDGSGSGGDTPVNPPSGDGEVYTLTNELKVGEQYLIVTASSGSGVHALSNNNGSIGSVDNLSVVNSTITTDSSTAVWTAEQSGDYVVLKNNNGWLYCSGSGLSINSTAPTNRGAQYSNNALTIKGSNTQTYYVYYDGGFKGDASHNSAKLYLFKSGAAAPETNPPVETDPPVVEMKTYVPAYQLVEGGKYLIVNAVSACLRTAAMAPSVRRLWT